MLKSIRLDPVGGVAVIYVDEHTSDLLSNLQARPQAQVDMYGGGVILLTVRIHELELQDARITEPLDYQSSGLVEMELKFRWLKLTYCH